MPKSASREKLKKRVRTLETKSGSLALPLFMPDATRGYVKSLSRDDLLKAGVGPMVVNTYHLYLQPGIELVKYAGGIHKFMNWPHPLLSDSGGYQVFSLIHKSPEMGKITDDEVIFKSPLDGSKHILTPEKSIQIQFDLGGDMMVVLDDPPPNYYSREKIELAVERTIVWAERCMIEYKRQLKIRKITEENRPLIFCVIQGGPYIDLRKKCAERLMEIGFSAKSESRLKVDESWIQALNWDGYGFGARHLDSEGNIMEEVLEKTASFIPEDKLRFALGVGTPGDIVKCANWGWDMFDCVIPTREGRHGRLFIWKQEVALEDKFYETININNEKFKEDFSPVDANCDCELCKNHTRAYLRHLFASGDPLAMKLAAIHNLGFYMQLMNKLREKTT